MCKSGKNADVINPTSRKRNKSSSSTQGTTSNPSSSSNNNYSNITSGDFTSNSNFNFDSKSSVASKASLSSLRDSLPENPHIYDFSEICSATNNFLAKKFKSSSSSTSWRAKIQGKEVLIFQRKLRRSLDLQQLSDRLSVICRSHHSSLIKLLGASISGNFIYLVYEYVSGVNLADCLRNPRNLNFTVLSTWVSRMKVATDLAHGLDYIHHCSGLLDSVLIHNHIKSNSIIVTEQENEPSSFSAKFCHFGTAELCGEIMENRNNKGKLIEGTRGYMAPEFQVSGSATQKTDVYAFGVVLLELFSGEEALRFVVDEGSGVYKRISVVDKAREAVDGGVSSGGGVRWWVDKRLRDSFPVEVAEKMVVLGLQCVDEDPEKRPDMRRVAGLVSKLYLESKNWADSIGVLTDFSVSMAPR